MPITSEELWARITPEALERMTDEQADKLNSLIEIVDRREVVSRSEVLDTEDDEQIEKLLNVKKTIKLIESKTIAARQNQMYQKHLGALQQRCHVGKHWGDTLRHALNELDLHGYTKFAGKAEILVNVIRDRVQKLFNYDVVVKLVAIQDFIQRQHRFDIELVV